jgi:hypothetical protein
LAGYLAGALRVPGYLGRHAAWFSVRQVVVALIFIAVFVALLAAPLLWEALCNLFSKGVEKAAPGGFVLGLVILLTGLASGVKVLDIAGGAVLGAVVLGVIIDNYLGRLPEPPDQHGARPERRAAEDLGQHACWP